ncbi:MAG: hypothetical protein K2Y23_15460 [Cyanobacteria bacterium]|nr:hypothetical protein [Cyanobacteriota bacterium]
MIVGVVGNASLGNPRQTDVPVFYRPTLQAGLFANDPDMVIATHGDPLAIVPAVNQAIREGGREYAHQIATLQAVFERSPSSERMGATLAGAMALLALIIAFIGVYGLLAYTVSRRTREIGVPLAIVAARSLQSLMFGVTASDPGVLALTTLFFLLLGAAAGLIPGRRASRVDPVSALRTE